MPIFSSNSVTALKDWDIYNIDIKTAYLYSNLNEKIYIEQPEGFRLLGKEKSLVTLQSIV